MAQTNIYDSKPTEGDELYGKSDEEINAAKSDFIKSYNQPYTVTSPSGEATKYNTADLPSGITGAGTYYLKSDGTYTNKAASISFDEDTGKITVTAPKTFLESDGYTSNLKTVLNTLSANYKLDPDYQYTLGTTDDDGNQETKSITDIISELSDENSSSGINAYAQNVLTVEGVRKYTKENNGVDLNYDQALEIVSAPTSQSNSSDSVVHIPDSIADVNFFKTASSYDKDTNTISWEDFANLFQESNFGSTGLTQDNVKNIYTSIMALLSDPSDLTADEYVAVQSFAKAFLTSDLVKDSLQNFNENIGSFADSFAEGFSTVLGGDAGGNIVTTLSNIYDALGGESGRTEGAIAYSPQVRETFENLMSDAYNGITSSYQDLLDGVIRAKELTLNEDGVVTIEEKTYQSNQMANSEYVEAAEYYFEQLVDDFEQDRENTLNQIYNPDSIGADQWGDLTGKMVGLYFVSKGVTKLATGMLVQGAEYLSYASDVVTEASFNAEMNFALTHSIYDSVEEGLQMAKILGKASKYATMLAKTFTALSTTAGLLSSSTLLDFALDALGDAFLLSSDAFAEYITSDDDPDAKARFTETVIQNAAWYFGMMGGGKLLTGFLQNTKIGRILNASMAKGLSNTHAKLQEKMTKLNIRLRDIDAGGLKYRGTAEDLVLQYVRRTQDMGGDSYRAGRRNQLAEIFGKRATTAKNVKNVVGSSRSGAEAFSLLTNSEELGKLADDLDDTIDEIRKAELALANAENAGQRILQEITSANGAISNYKNTVSDYIELSKIAKSDGLLQGAGKKVVWGAEIDGTRVTFSALPQEVNNYIGDLGTVARAQNWLNAADATANANTYKLYQDLLSVKTESVAAFEASHSKELVEQAQKFYENLKITYKQFFDYATQIGLYSSKELDAMRASGYFGTTGDDYMPLAKKRQQNEYILTRRDGRFADPLYQNFESLNPQVREADFADMYAKMVLDVQTLANKKASLDFLDMYKSTGGNFATKISGKDYEFAQKSSDSAYKAYLNSAKHDVKSVIRETDLDETFRASAAVNTNAKAMDFAEAQASKNLTSISTKLADGTEVTSAKTASVIDKWDYDTTYTQYRKLNLDTKASKQLEKNIEDEITETVENIANDTVKQSEKEVARAQRLADRATEANKKATERATKFVDNEVAKAKKKAATEIIEDDADLKASFRKLTLDDDGNIVAKKGYVLEGADAGTLPTKTKTTTKTVSADELKTYSKEIQDSATEVQGEVRRATTAELKAVVLKDYWDYDSDIGALLEDYFSTTGKNLTAADVERKAKQMFNWLDSHLDKNTLSETEETTARNAFKRLKEVADAENFNFSDDGLKKLLDKFGDTAGETKYTIKLTEQVPDTSKIITQADIDKFEVQDGAIVPKGFDFNSAGVVNTQEKALADAINSNPNLSTTYEKLTLDDNNNIVLKNGYTLEGETPTSTPTTPLPQEASTTTPSPQDVANHAMQNAGDIDDIKQPADIQRAIEDTYRDATGIMPDEASEEVRDAYLTFMKDNNLRVVLDEDGKQVLAGTKTVSADELKTYSEEVQKTAIREQGEFSAPTIKEIKAVVNEGYWDIDSDIGKLIRNYTDDFYTANGTKLTRKELKEYAEEQFNAITNILKKDELTAQEEEQIQNVFKMLKDASDDLDFKFKRSDEGLKKLLDKFTETGEPKYQIALPELATDNLKQAMKRAESLPEYVTDASETATQAVDSSKIVSQADIDQFEVQDGAIVPKGFSFDNTSAGTSPEATVRAEAERLAQEKYPQKEVPAVPTAITYTEAVDQFMSSEDFNNLLIASNYEIRPQLAKNGRVYNRVAEVASFDWEKDSFRTHLLNLQDAGLIDNATARALKNKASKYINGATVLAYNNHFDPVDYYDIIVQHEGNFVKGSLKMDFGTDEINGFVMKELLKNSDSKALQTKLGKQIQSEYIQTQNQAWDEAIEQAGKQFSDLADRLEWGKETLKNNMENQLDTIVDAVKQNGAVKKETDAVLAHFGMQDNDTAREAIALHAIVTDRQDIQSEIVKAVKKDLQSNQAKLDLLKETTADMTEEEIKAIEKYNKNLKSFEKLSGAEQEHVAKKYANMILDEAERRYADTIADLSEVNEAIASNGKEWIYGEMSKIQESLEGVEKADNIIWRYNLDGELEAYETSPLMATLFNYSPKNTKTHVLGLQELNAFTAKLYRIGTTSLRWRSWVNQWFRDPVNVWLSTGDNPFNASDKTLREALGDTVTDEMRRAMADIIGEDAANALKSTDEVADILGRTEREAIASGVSTKAQYHNLSNASKVNQSLEPQEISGWDRFQTKMNDIVDFLSTPNDFRETMVRKASYNQEFAKAYKATGSLAKARTRASFAALNAATDFSRSVTMLYSWQNSIPYLRSAFNGQASFYRMLRLDPIGVTGRVISGVVLPQLYLTTMSLSDEESKKTYESIPEYEKEDAIVFAIGSNAYSVPIPQEMSAMLAPFRQLAEHLQGAKSSNTGWEFATNDILQYSPIDITGFANLDFSEFSDKDFLTRMQTGVSRVWSQVAPPLAKSVVSTFTGVDPYTMKQIDTSYVTIDEDGNAVVMDYKTNQAVQNIVNAINKNTGWTLSAPVVANFLNNLIGNAPMDVLDFIGDLANAIEEDTVGETVGSGLYDLTIGQLEEPLTASTTSNIETQWNAVVTTLYREKESILNNETYQKLKTNLQEATTTSARRKIQGQIYDITSKYYADVQKAVQTLVDKDPDAFNVYKYGSVLSLMTLSTDTLSSTAYGATLNEDLYKEARAEAIQTMLKMGFPSTNDVRSLGYYRISDDGDVYVQMRSPLEILQMQGTTGLANISAMENEGIITNVITNSNAYALRSAYYDEVHPLYEAGDYDAIEEAKQKYDQQILNILAPTINKYGIENIIASDDVVNYLEGWLIVPQDYMGSAKYLSASGTGIQKNPAFIRKYLRAVFGYGSDTIKSEDN